MDAILLCMKKRGIRFFSKINFKDTNVARFHTKDKFLGLLRSRTREFDNILLLAHGSSNAILTTTNDLNKPYDVYISADDAGAFRNDFIFAVSCSTANEFGKHCIDKGAIAYLGYQTELGCLFYSYCPKNSCLPKRISTTVDIIIKRIFIEELARAYEEFLKKPLSVRVLRERFSYLLEKRIAELTQMSAVQFSNIHHVKLTENSIEKFVVELVLNVLSYLDGILPRLVCIGDENYISASYIAYRKRDGVECAQVLRELECNEFFQALTHETYKQHLRVLAVDN